MDAMVAPVLVLIALSFAPLRAQESAPDLTAARTAIERLAKTMEKVERIRAHYVQYQESLLLAEPLVSKGTLHLRAEPACLLLELAEPRPVIVRSDPKSHQMYWPTEKLAERWLFRSNELARALLRCFSADIRAVEEIFEIRAFTPGEKTSELLLVPRDDKLRRYLATLSLTLSNETGNLVGITHQNAEGERVRFELSELDLAPDPTVENALFDRPLPSDVRLLVHEVKEPK
jgi:hypothetical protein